MSVNRRRKPYVYFIRPKGFPGPVKIGCSQMPLDRLAAMSVWSPLPLEVVASTPGDEELERRFHALFRDQHSHGEWFHASRSLTDTMEAVAAGTFDCEALPAPRKVPGLRKPPWTVEQRLNVHMQHALTRLKGSGVAIPEAVEKAAYRYSLCGSAFHPVSRERADAEILQAFLAGHIHRLKDPRPLIAVSREAGFMLPRAA